MRYQLHDKPIKGSGSIIQDASGNDIYTVDSQGIIGLGKNLVLKDMHRKIQANIQQKIFATTPTFDVKLSSGLKAKLSTRGLFGPDRVKIEVAGQPDMEAHGKFGQHDYIITRDGQTVAQISKEWITPENTLGDPYGIEIDDSQDPMLLLCCALVADIYHQIRTD